MSSLKHGHDVQGITLPQMKQAEAETLRRYGDILDCPRPEGNRPKASPRQRAAQFLPFAALVGYDEEIRREGAYAEARIEPDDAAKEEISHALRLLASSIGTRPEVRLTVFEQIPEKAGGIYCTKTGRVKRIDPVRQLLYLDGGGRIAFEDLYGIELLQDSEDGSFVNAGASDGKNR